MKRSEFVIDVNRAVVMNADWLELARVACKGDLGFFGQLAAQKAEEAGATWDPEEPELPERIKITTIPSPHTKEQSIPALVDEGRPFRGILGADIPTLFRIAREAAARYNTWERLLEVAKSWPVQAMPGLKEILADEREKLQ